MVTTEEIKENFPLHYLVWNNDYQDLKSFIDENPVSIYKYMYIYNEFNLTITK